MFGSATIEVAIGVIFLFFILSLLATTVREIIEGYLQSRAGHLERGIRELFNDRSGAGLTKSFYDHPLIASLYTGDYEPRKQLAGKEGGAKDPWKKMKVNSNLPAYIPARNFASALLDLTARGVTTHGVLSTDELNFESIRSGVEKIDNQRVQRAVLIALDQAKGDLDQARANLEAWFDSGMDRVSGRYRKQTQSILFTIGLIIAVALNIDTARIATHLYENEEARALVVAEAKAAVEAAGEEGMNSERMLRAIGCDPAATGRASVSCSQKRLEKLGLPIGWEGYVWPWQVAEGGYWNAFGVFLISILGWLITALAVTLGAPFWFDLLNKMMVIRSTVKPHEKSPEEDSEDRQQSAPRKVKVFTAEQDSRAPGAAEATGPLDRPELDDPAFEPHVWKDGEDPQEGNL